MLIRDIPFIVVDTETTGGKADEDRLIEVAAVRVQEGAVVDRFSSLMDPERGVPRRIQELTGISTAMVFGKPVAAEVMPRLLDFLGEGVFAAHNLPFDRRFVDAELRRLGRPPLSNPMLCTLRLARRLLPGLRSKGLSSVADFYGVPIQARHRALGDAEATAEVLLRFLDQLGREHGVETLEELLAFQYRTYGRKVRSPKHLRHIREDVLERLPDGPGVYFMHDRAGTILYIGKAKSLQARVRSYFTGVEGHPPRIRKLIEAVRDVTWTETGSELGALLLESRLIKEHQPRFNRAQRRYRSRPFIRLDPTDPFPRVSWTPYLLNDGAEYFGPLGGSGQARTLIEVIDRFFRLCKRDDDTFARGTGCLYASMDRCDAPCVGGEKGGVYTAEVQRVRDFLMGRDTTVFEQIEDAMRQAAAKLDFEEAAELRNQLQQLERMRGRQECVAAPVLEHNAVVFQPDARAGSVQLFLVRFGRLVETFTLDLPASPVLCTQLRDRLACCFYPEQAEPDRYFKREAEEIRILAHWMYVHRDSTRQVSWRPGLAPADFAAAVFAELEHNGAAARTAS